MNMKVKVERKVLLNVLKRFSTIFGRDYVLFMEASHRKLILKAGAMTGKVSGISQLIYIPAQVDEVGEVAIDVTLLRKYVELLRDDLSLETTKNMLFIRSGISTVCLPLNLHNFFVDLNEQEMIWETTLPARDFWNIVKRVHHCASRDGTKPSFTYIEFSLKDNELSASTTDGFSLAKLTKPLVAADTYFLINAVDLAKCINLSNTAPLTLQVSENYIHILQTEEQFGTKIILYGEKTKFPDIDTAIPKTHKASLAIERDHLLRHLKLASFVAFDGATSLRFDSNRLEICSVKSEFGEYNSSMVGRFEGEIDIYFAYKLVQRCVEQVPNKMIEMKFNGSTKPLSIISKNDNENLLYVIMPMYPPR